MIPEKKILVLSTGDNHGAYEASYKIAKFLFEAGYIVALGVKSKTKPDPFVVQIQLVAKPKVNIFKNLKRRLLDKFAGAKDQFSYATDYKYAFLTKNENAVYVSADIILAAITFIPDLIIAGMTDKFCNTNTLSDLKKLTNAKIYTWLVDMEPLTGGCHFAWDCTGYQHACDNCPAILDESKKNVTSVNLNSKLQNILKSDIRVLSGSDWVTEQAKKSTLYKGQKNIYNTHACIDTRVLNGKNREIAKRVFNIPDEAKIIFTGSWNVNDPRKGMPFFLEALNILWETIDPVLKNNIYILIAGEHYEKKDFLAEIPFKKLHIDYIKDYRLLSLAYQSADIFVCASIEDPGPMMVSEALACGTPVVGFRMGNVYSMVENDYNGYVAELKNSKDLAFGLKQILSLSKQEFESYSKNAIEKVELVASHHAAVKVIESLFDDN